MPANYVLLERIELNASAASVTFANIPQSGYTDLKIVMSIRGTATNVANAQYLSINGSSGSTNFTGKLIEGDGASAYSVSPNQFIGNSTNANATANTFSNIEVYFPNYTSSNNKSYSMDSVSENNATTAYASIFGGLWSQTAAITSLGFSQAGGNYVANSTFSLYGLAAVGTTPVIAPKATGGNLIENDGTYWIHTFYSTGTFTPLQGLSCDYLVVAGGGGGGSRIAGGGGAGGLRSTVTATGGGGSLESALTVTGGTNYTVTIGAGGAGAPAGGSNPGTRGSTGSNSIFSTITSDGGGGGGLWSGTSGANGGSGGGGSPDAGSTVRVGGTRTINQGFNGGNGALASAGNYGGGGGGGAGAAGATGTANGGAGGNGVAVSISGSSVTYAGGGGGSVEVTGTPGAGGSGGGGAAGAANTTNAGTNGTANLGGGGGGGGNNTNTGGTGGAGGSGIVIIRYPIA